MKAFKIILCVAFSAASLGLLYLAYSFFSTGRYVWTDGYHDNLEVHPTEGGTLAYLRGLLFFSLPALAAFLPAVLFGFIAFRLGVSVARGSSSHHADQLHGT